MDLKLSDGFFDLCVNCVSDTHTTQLKSVLLKLYEMGYRTIALNQIVHEDIFDTNKKRKKQKCDENKQLSSVVPNPIDISQLSQEFEGKLCILNRITFVCSDVIKTHTLAQCASLKKYNLYAIVPNSQAMLQYACSQINADLITIRPSISNIKMNRKLYQQAVERGLSFEIQYADILDPKARKMAIYYSHLFFTNGKSMNVIISSGASNINHIRSPYDIINLGSILGLSEEKSKASILKESQLLVLRAERRRCGKAVFTIKFTEESIEEEDTFEEIL